MDARLLRCGRIVAACAPERHCESMDRAPLTRFRCRPVLRTFRWADHAVGTGHALGVSGEKHNCRADHALVCDHFWSRCIGLSRVPVRGPLRIQAGPTHTGGGSQAALRPTGIRGRGEDSIQSSMAKVSEASDRISARVSWLASIWLCCERSIPFFSLEYRHSNDTAVGLDTYYVRFHLAMGVLAMPALRLCIQGEIRSLLPKALPLLRTPNVGGIARCVELPFNDLCLGGSVSADTGRRNGFGFGDGPPNAESG